MHQVFTIFALLLFSVYIFGEQCDLKDQKCTKEAIQRLYPVVVAGDASLGVESSDPLTKDRIEGNLPALKYNLTNTRLYGMSNCEVRDANFKIADDYPVWNMFLNCPKLKLQMHYTMAGFIISEWVSGEGEAELNFDTYEISMQGNIQKEVRGDNNMYIQLTNLKVPHLEVTKKANFMFNDLVPGDKRATERMNNIINANWQEFNNQAQTPAMTAHVNLLIDHCNQYFDKVPIDEIFTY